MLLGQTSAALLPVCCRWMLFERCRSSDMPLRYRRRQRTRRPEQQGHDNARVVEARAVTPMTRVGDQTEMAAGGS